jgi:hypothetical protein
MKMVLKGILTWEDGEIAADSGIDAIIVSTGIPRMIPELA